MVFQGCRKLNFLFFCFWLGLLFCRLLWNDFDELGSVMECDPSCSMDTLYEQCESWFWRRRIGAFRGAKEGGERESYMKLAEEKEGRFLGSGEKQSSCFFAS